MRPLDILTCERLQCQNKAFIQMLHIDLTPPPTVTKNIMYFFLKLDHYWDTQTHQND